MQTGAARLAGRPGSLADVRPGWVPAEGRQLTLRSSA
jgi:hypothetical protein